MKILKKALSVSLAATMLFGSMSVCAADVAATAKDVDYTITSPYAGVNWDSVKQYKTALHTHTNASDGDITLRTSLETHALQGFDLVATTDHGINNKGWANKESSNYKFIYNMLKAIGRTEGELDYLGESGTFANSGCAYTLATRQNGDEYLTVSMPDGTQKDIMRIPYGIENNALSINAHVNSWFVDYQDNGLNDYVDAIRGVNKAGGICVINHPGEYTKAKEDLTSDIAYNESNLIYRYYINKFYGLMQRYPACIGIDINSKGDSRTRYDRELWDILLQRATAGGKNVYAIASSDAHQSDKINTGYVRLLMNDMNSVEARKALESGAFFAASFCNGNQKELENVVDNLQKFYGESELLTEVNAVVTEMQQRVADVESGKADADEGPTGPLRMVDSDGYFHGKETYITSVSVDNAEDTITIGTDNALLVTWIANGEVIAVTKADEGISTIDLDDYADKLGTYVRAEVFGEGGFIYTQAFVLSYDGQPTEQHYPYINIPVIDALFAEVRNLGVVLGRVFKNLFK